MSSQTQAVPEGIQEHMQAVMRAEELANELKPKAVDPKSLLDLYRPMHFSKLHNGYAVIQEMEAECWPAVDMRRAFHLGVPMVSIRFEPGTKFHKLFHRGQMWTTDTPLEIYTQYLEFHRVRGNVLVGGLGLGMAAQMMLELPDVRSVTVVEYEKEIIDLIQPQIDRDIEVIHGDIYKYLAKGEWKKEIHSAYFDTWCGTGEATWSGDVVPLYRLARHRGVDVVSAWGEQEMHSQLRTGLFHRALMAPLKEDARWYKTFIGGCARRIGHLPPYSDAELPEVTNLVNHFLNDVGRWGWEQVFKWGRLAKTRGRQ